MSKTGFIDIENRPLPKSQGIFNLSNLDNDTDFRGGIRVRAGTDGYVKMGNFGKDENGNLMYGVIINDGTKNIFFAGFQVDGF